jgi:hypothetical protein
VANEARVSRFMVSHVFHGRAKSQNVLDSAHRLLAARDA